MRRHGPGQVRIQGKRQQVRFEVVRLDARQIKVAVDMGTPMTRNMLGDWLDPGRELTTLRKVLEDAGAEPPRRVVKAS